MFWIAPEIQTGTNAIFEVVTFVDRSSITTLATSFRIICSFWMMWSATTTRRHYNSSIKSCVSHYSLWIVQAGSRWIRIKAQLATLISSPQAGELRWPPNYVPCPFQSTIPFRINGISLKRDTLLTHSDIVVLQLNFNLVLSIQTWIDPWQMDNISTYSALDWNVDMSIINILMKSDPVLQLI